MRVRSSDRRRPVQRRSQLPYLEFSTDSQPVERRAHFWETANRETVLPIIPQVSDPASFRGHIRNWRIADIAISCIKADPCQYRRDRDSIACDRERYTLVSFAVGSSYAVTQANLELTFNDGTFVIQQTDVPYSFLQHDRGEVWVLRIPQSKLAARIGAVDRVSSQVFEARRGLGALLFTSLCALPTAAAEVDEALHLPLANQLVELLALTLEADERILSSRNGTVQDAHLSRVQRFVRTHISDPDLSPSMIASGCGISLRYLHALFQSTGMTVGHWVRDQRLLGCQRDLANPRCNKGVAEIAYAWGFNDHARFSRVFKEQCGITPSQFRADALASGA